MSLFPKFCLDGEETPSRRQSPTGRFVWALLLAVIHRSLGVLFAHQVRTRSHRDPSRTCLLRPHSSRAATARSPPPLFIASRNFQVCPKASCCRRGGARGWGAEGDLRGERAGGRVKPHYRGGAPRARARRAVLRAAHHRARPRPCGCAHRTL